MNFKTGQGRRITILQIPFLILIAGGILSLPLLGYSLFHIIKRIDADGVWFCLFFGLFMLWLFLEVPATREKFIVDLDKQSLSRIVSGVFRRRKQFFDLTRMKQIKLELRKDSRGRYSQYLFISGNDEQHLINSPSKKLNHRATGKLLSEVTGLPYNE